MAGLSDILTTAQNIASAINGLAQVYLNVQGGRNATALTAATLVKAGAGRLATVTVTDAGSGDGAIYDANNVTAVTGLFYVIPMTVGVFVVNFPVSFGIVVAPGTGQTVSVSYSEALK